MSRGAEVVGSARLHICIHIFRFGGKFYISQPFGPGRGRSEPQEGQKSSQEKIQHWGTARLPVHMLIAQVYNDLFNVGFSTTRRCTEKCGAIRRLEFVEEIFKLLKCGALVDTGNTVDDEASIAVTTHSGSANFAWNCL